MPTELLIKSFIAGIIACLACGLGALPLLIKGIDPKKHTGLGYACAGGLMVSASFYNLIFPAVKFGGSATDKHTLFYLVGGILLGALFLTLADKYLSKISRSNDDFKKWGGRAGLLIFLAMSLHSMPEGIAVGVGYASESVIGVDYFGQNLAIAIGLHNIPEGLAVSIPLRAAGASINRCFWTAVLTSVPQPLAALPATYASWLFEPLMPWFMGFAAGAMIFLVIEELIPSALKETNCHKVAWAFMFGFSAMLLLQILL